LDGSAEFCGNLSGIVAPALTGFVLERTGHFYWPFAILSAIALIGSLSWFFLVGPVREVSWPIRTTVSAVPAEVQNT